MTLELIVRLEDELLRSFMDTEDETLVAAARILDPRAMELAEETSDILNGHRTWVTHAHANSGWISIYTKNYDKAVQAYTKVIELLSTDSDDDHDEKGFIARLGSFFGSIWNHTETTSDPKIYLKAVAYTNRARVLNWNYGKLEDSIQDSTTAIELEPKIGTAYFMRADAFIGLGRLNEAIQDSDTGIKLNPTSFVPWTNRGHANILLGNYEEAIPDLEMALEVDSKNTNAIHAFLGDAHRGLGNTEVARVFYEHALQMAADRPSGIRNPNHYFGAISAERGLKSMGFETGTDYEREAVETGFLCQQRIDLIRKI